MENRFRSVAVVTRFVRANGRHTSVTPARCKRECQQRHMSNAILSTFYCTATSEVIRCLAGRNKTFLVDGRRSLARSPGGVKGVAGAGRGTASPSPSQQI